MGAQRGEVGGARARSRSGSGRLSRSGDFERAYRRGRSVANRHIALYVFPRGGSGSPRVGISVSRRVGGAVVRNRIKRLLREALRAEEEGLTAGHDYVAVARPPAAQLAEREGLAGVSGALSELVQRAGGSDEGRG